jgi:hypothetical protein
MVVGIRSTIGRGYRKKIAAKPRRRSDSLLLNPENAVGIATMFQRGQRTRG